jgi:hypothetical protein
VQPFHQPNHPPPAASVKQAADDARRRIESELHGLAALERELDRLDRQLSALRSQIVRAAERADS